MPRRAVVSSALVFVVSAVLVVATLRWPTPGLVSLLGLIAVVGLTTLAYVLTASRDRQYRRVVEQVDQVIFQLDTDARWVFLSPAWPALTGLDVAATLGRPFVQALHPDDRPDVQALLEALIARRREDCRIDVRLVTRSGAACWVDLRARLIRDGGKPVGVVGTLADVTTRRQVQQELERARTAAERASATRSEFLKSMSHEMRTPLNGVLGLLELLSTTRLDAQQARFVSVARASATHLGTLITDVLDVSRLEAGGLTLDRTLFDLPDLLESSLDPVAADAGARGLRLSCTVTQAVPTWVIGDPGRLRQVLVNLLVNAVKFTERGGVHLQADAQVDLDTRRAMLQIEVQDTGIGIAPDRLERLLTPFSPAETRGTRRQGGTGLGLTICERLVDAMHGSITVRSVEGAGTTFTIVLPIDVADAAMVESGRESDTPVRVLAVLVDEAERAAIRRLLDGWRFDAAVVGDCDAAWGHVGATGASRWRFGVVLLDSQAPGAAAFARKLREVTPEPGVIWLIPQEGRLPPEITGIREQVARPVKGEALFDAIMQAVVSSMAVADPARASSWRRVPRVLVAEDHDVNQLVVRELLLGMGCTVDVVANGEDAVVAALATPYDVILMDCQMPVLDGLEATRRIRGARAAGHTTHDPGIIALTANATPDDRRACLEAGMDAYLTKPVRSNILQRTMQRLLAEGVRARAAGHEHEHDGAGAPATVAAELGETPDADDILDPAEVLLRCNRNGDLGARMLQLFAESLPGELEALEAAAAANDPQAVGKLAHKLRGAAATLAATRLAGAVSGVELFLKYGDGGPLSDLVADVRHESALFLGVVPQVVRRLTQGAETHGA